MGLKLLPLRIIGTTYLITFDREYILAGGRMIDLNRVSLITSGLWRLLVFEF